VLAERSRNTKSKRETFETLETSETKNYCMRTILIITLLLFASIAQSGFGQQTGQRREILNELNSTARGRGRVTVYEDENIKHVLGRPMVSRPVTIGADGSAFHEMRGFRIQAYAGNDQRVSRQQAEDRKKLFDNAFPEYETNVIFTAPFWRLRVGNFETRDEAEEAMHEMRRRFPAFGRELSIVQDDVRIPVNR
jgi:hypothetical protein